MGPMVNTVAAMEDSLCGTSLIRASGPVTSVVTLPTSAMLIISFVEQTVRILLHLGIMAPNVVRLAPFASISSFSPFS